MISLQSLVLEAARHGLTVHLSHIDDAAGFYDHDAGEIHVEMGLPLAELKETIAHELGHAHHSHACGSDRAERQARAYAARLLVDHHDYAAAERINSDAWAIADELGVTTDVVHDFRHFVLRGRPRFRRTA